MICGLCQQDVPRLVKSHIIAKAIATHGRPKGSQDPLVILPSNKDQRSKPSRTGIYDEIVCSSCEARFQAGDDALLALLRSLGQGVPFAYENGRPLGVSYPNADVEGVHRGILSTLFRAHLSSNSMFQHVVLDPVHEQRIRELLLSNASTFSSIYSVVLRVIVSEQGMAVASPFRETMDGVEVIRFYFPNLTAYIKVDERPFGNVFQHMTIGNSPQLQAVLKEQLSSSEMDFFRHVTDGRDADLARYGPKTKD